MDFLIGSTVYGTLPAIVDPTDGVTAVTPTSLTALVIKNGTDTADSVTITAVGGGRTGVYKWSYNPAGEVEGDEYSVVFTIVIAGTDYYHTVDLRAVAAERGTDGANTVVPDNSNIAAAATSAASADGKLTPGRLSRIDRLPDINAGDAGGVALVGSEMTLDAATLTALFADADVAGLIASITALFDQATDLPVQTIAAQAAAATVTAIVANGQMTTLFADAAASKAAAETNQATLASGVTVSDILQAALAKFATEATGQSAAANQSIAQLSQGAAGSGNVSAFSGDAQTAINNILNTVGDAIAQALAQVQLTTGTVEGFPAQLRIGDAYPDFAKIYPKDSAGNIITAVNGRDFTTEPTTHAFRIRRHQSNGPALATGTISWVNAPVSGDPHFLLSLDVADTDSLTPGVFYWQVIAWADSEHETTIASSSVQLEFKIDASS